MILDGNVENTITGMRERKIYFTTPEYTVPGYFENSVKS